MELIDFGLRAAGWALTVACPGIAALYFWRGYRWGYRPSAFGLVLIVLVIGGTPFRVWNQVLRFQGEDLPAYAWALGQLPVWSLIIGILADFMPKVRLLVDRRTFRDLVGKGREAYRIATIDYERRKNTSPALQRSEVAFREALTMAPDSPDVLLNLAGALYLRSLTAPRANAETILKDAKALSARAAKMHSKSRESEIYKLIAALSPGAGR